MMLVICDITISGHILTEECMQDTGNGGIKYTHLYHAIAKLRPQAEREDKDGPLNAGCIQLLFQLATRAEMDGTNIHLDTAKLAEACFCGRWEIQNRIKTLLNYGYIRKALDSSGKPIKYKRHLIYDLYLPGVHDVEIEAAAQPVRENFLSQFEEEEEEEKPKKQVLGLPIGYTEEEFYNKQTVIMEEIIKDLRNGVLPRRLKMLAFDWNIDLDSCIEAAKELITT
jgi:hypothetical protein